MMKGEKAYIVECEVNEIRAEIVIYDPTELVQFEREYGITSQSVREVEIIDYASPAEDN